MDDPAGDSAPRLLARAEREAELTAAMGRASMRIREV